MEKARKPRDPKAKVIRLYLADAPRFVSRRIGLHFTHPTVCVGGQPAGVADGLRSAPPILRLHPAHPGRLHPTHPTASPRSSYGSTPLILSGSAPPILRLHPAHPGRLHPTHPTAPPRSSERLHPAHPERLHPAHPGRLHPAHPEWLHPAHPERLHPAHPERSRRTSVLALVLAAAIAGFSSPLLASGTTSPPPETSAPACTKPSDCPHGACLHTRDGGRCTKACQTDADCAAPGFCQTWRGMRGHVERYCTFEGRGWRRR